jgi:hypothetical protein
LVANGRDEREERIEREDGLRRAATGTKAEAREAGDLLIRKVGLSPAIQLNGFQEDGSARACAGHRRGPFKRESLGLDFLVLSGLSSSGRQSAR